MVHKRFLSNGKLGKGLSFFQHPDCSCWRTARAGLSIFLLHSSVCCALKTSRILDPYWQSYYWYYCLCVCYFLTPFFIWDWKPRNTNSKSLNNNVEKLLWLLVFLKAAVFMPFMLLAEIFFLIFPIIQHYFLLLFLFLYSKAVLVLDLVI